MKYTREHIDLKYFVEQMCHSMKLNLVPDYYEAASPVVTLLLIRLAAIDHCGTINP